MIRLREYLRNNKAKINFKYTLQPTDWRNSLIVGVQLYPFYYMARRPPTGQFVAPFVGIGGNSKLLKIVSDLNKLSTDLDLTVYIAIKWTT